MRHDIDKDLSPGTKLLGPTIFKDSTSPAIEIGVLDKVVEPVARTIEPDGDIMTAIISRAPVFTSSLSLRIP